QIQAALRWKDSYRDQIVAAVITSGAIDWQWIEHKTGVVFEVSFADEDSWERFRALPGVQAALDGAPDPVYGVLVYRGRGGTAGSRQPKRPRPSTGAGALELSEPTDQRILNLKRAEAVDEVLAQRW
ncbi:MAG TPA: hypothetical protein VF979_00380, partial [Streptosporangiaceae bacterium]